MSSGSVRGAYFLFLGRVGGGGVLGGRRRGRGVLGRGGSVLGLGGVLGGLVGSIATLGGRGVLGLSLVADIGDEALGGGLVADDLHPAVREVDTVLSVQVAVSILLLLLGEVSAGVLIPDAVLVGEGLGGKLLLLVRRGLVGAGRGGVGGGGLVGGRGLVGGGGLVGGRRRRRRGSVGLGGLVGVGVVGDGRCHQGREDEGLEGKVKKINLATLDHTSH